MPPRVEALGAGRIAFGSDCPVQETGNLLGWGASALTVTAG